MEASAGGAADKGQRRGARSGAEKFFAARSCARRDEPRNSSAQACQRKLPSEMEVAAFLSASAIGACLRRAAGGLEHCGRGGTLLRPRRRASGRAEMVDQGLAVDARGRNRTALVAAASTRRRRRSPRCSRRRRPARAHDDGSAAHAAAAAGAPGAAVLGRLLDHCRPARDALDARGRTAPHGVRARPRRAAELLVARGADLEALTPDKRTPLALAAAAGAADAARACVERGAAIEAADGAGDRPLHLAAKGGHDRCCELLLEAGARLHAPNGAGATPLELAVSDGAARRCGRRRRGAAKRARRRRRRRRWRATTSQPSSTNSRSTAELLNQALQEDAALRRSSCATASTSAPPCRAPPSTAPRELAATELAPPPPPTPPEAPPDTTSDAALAARIRAIADAIEIDPEVMRAASEPPPAAVAYGAGLAPPRRSFSCS